MFVKLILIVSMFSFVCVQSIENKAQQLSLLAETNPDTSLDTDAAVIISSISHEERGHALRVSTTNKSPVITTGDEYVMIHSKLTNPKKRATDYKEHRETDLRPGCC
ncbi:unnamed protein product, partial [Heterotrigona itama]